MTFRWHVLLGLLLRCIARVSCEGHTQVLMPILSEFIWSILVSVNYLISRPRVDNLTSRLKCRVQLSQSDAYFSILFRRLVPSLCSLRTYLLMFGFNRDSLWWRSYFGLSLRCVQRWIYCVALTDASWYLCRKRVTAVNILELVAPIPDFYE